MSLLNGDAADDGREASSDGQVLELLRRFFRSQETRVAITKEFQEAFESNLKAPPSDADGALDRTTCRDVSDAELGEIIKISTGGLLEVKEEINVISGLLRSRFSRPDVADLVDKVQALEVEKLKQNLLDNQEQRKAKVEGRDYTTIEGHSSGSDLVERINDALEEVRAEMAELAVDAA